MQERYTLKMVNKTGQIIGAYASEAILAELTSHPKFLKMQDDGNDVFVSIEDIAAFEILDFRKQTPAPASKENDEKSAPVAAQ